MNTKQIPEGWVSEKPDLEKECLVLTATFIGRYWDYKLFEITRIESDEGWYWGVLLDGEEWGDLDEIRADLYNVIPILTEPK